MAIKYLAWSAITNLIGGGFGSGSGKFLGNLFGVGAGSFGGASSGGGGLPTAPINQIGLPSGGGAGNRSGAIIAELRSLRLAVVQSDISNQKAIADNTPVIQGTMMDDIKVYKSSQVGKRKANFIVSPT